MDHPCLLGAKESPPPAIAPGRQWRLGRTHSIKAVERAETLCNVTEASFHFVDEKTPRLKAGAENEGYVTAPVERDVQRRVKCTKNLVDLSAASACGHEGFGSQCPISLRETGRPRRASDSTPFRLFNT
jgi:hypothetical protein